MERASLIVAALASGLLAGQDMVAVDWTGQIYTLDSYRAALTPLGSGLFGQNAAATTPDGTVWSTHRTGASPNWVYDLTRVDPLAGTAAVMHSGIPDVRAMAPAGPRRLWCIVNGNPDVLYAADTSTGVFTRIGSTGARGIEGLATMGDTLFAWSVASGLLVIDPSTGRASDVNGSIGGGGGDTIQFLVARSDGSLIGGKSDLYRIDPDTGEYTLIGTLGTSVDLRGAEEWYGNAHAFGVGCSGQYGTVALVASGGLRPGGELIVSSSNHAASVPGLLVLGVRRDVFRGLPLPIDLDPLLHTVGCSLWVSIDALVAGTTSAIPPALLTFRLPVPASVGGADLHLQHAALEPVPGGLSFSNGVTVHFGF
ncbi:MAG: hypothetical protein R3F56_18485 [Planctomycetota bacterium]